MALLGPEAAHIERVKRLAASNVYAFGKWFFPHILTAEPARFHWRWYDLIADPQVKRIVGVAHRLSAKTTIFAVVGGMWHALVKGHKVLIVSQSARRAIDWSSRMKSEFEKNERLRYYYGDMVGDRLWTTNMMELTNGGGIEAIGAGQQVRGPHPDVAIIDDLEDTESAETDIQRAKRSRWLYGDFWGSLKPTSKLIFYGTLAHPECLLLAVYNRAQTSPSWTTFNDPIWKDGESQWPAVWPTAEVEAKKAEMPAVEFAAEYENAIKSYVENPFRAVKTWTTMPATDDLFRVLVVDPAVGTNRRNCRAACLVLGMDHEQHVYVLDAQIDHFGPEALLETTVACWERWAPHKTAIEASGNQKFFISMFKNELRLRHPETQCDPVEIWSQGPKEDRILALEPSVRSGRFIVGEHHTRLLEEFRSWPTGAYIDGMDAAANGLRELIPPRKKEKPKLSAADYDALSYDERELRRAMREFQEEAKPAGAGVHAILGTSW